MLCVIRRLALLLLPVVFPAQAETLWEAGAGLTRLHLPLYPGTEQTRAYLIPFPFLRVQSDVYEVGDDGVKGFFLDSPSFRLNVSGDLGVPVDSSDSRLRDGMPNLDATLQLGPSLEMIFAGGRREAYEFRLELPLRAVIATDLGYARQTGWVVEPRLSYETLRPFKQGWAGSVSGGLRYASRRYHDFYYSVDPAYATATRPAYQAEAGYSGLFLDLVLNWRRGDWFFFGFLRYQNLDGTVFENSPLVETTGYVAVGVGFSYVIGGNRP